MKIDIGYSTLYDNGWYSIRLKEYEINNNLDLCINRIVNYIG